MKRLKSEKGAITIIVLTSILFMISFLISTYVIVANKIKTQKEIINEIRKTYEPEKSIEEIYNAYFDRERIIPIYNEEQLEIALSGNSQMVQINGKYYEFGNDENIVYSLMNRITIERLEEESLDISHLDSRFTGKPIEVIYTDENDATYSIEYVAENNYEEPSYDVKIIPKMLSTNGNVVTDARISIKDENGDYIEQQGTGEMQIKVKRLSTVDIIAQTDDYKGVLTIDNIKKSEDIIDYIIVLQQYKFSLNITTTPSDATIIYSIDGGENQTATGLLSAKYLFGTNIRVTVQKDKYTTETREYNINNSNIQENIAIQRLYKYKVVATPSNSVVKLTVNGEETTGVGSNEVYVLAGTNVSYYVKADYYQESSSNYTLNNDYTQNISLTANPEQTLPERLTPVSASDSPSGSVKNINDALKSGDKSASLKYAELGNGEAILLKFNIPANTIKTGAKITKCTINYNVGYGLKNSNITLNLLGNGTSYASTTKNGVSYPLASRYTWEITNTSVLNGINAANLLTKMELKITCTNRGCNVFGADIQMSYINK